MWLRWLQRYRFRRIDGFQIVHSRCWNCVRPFLSCIWLVVMAVSSCRRSSIKPPSFPWWLVTRSSALDSPTGSTKRRSAMIRLCIGVIAGVVVGVMIGISFSRVFSDSLWQLGIAASAANKIRLPEVRCEPKVTTTEVKPRGAETLPAGIINATTDLYLRRLWGRPEEDLPEKPKYLIAFTVGINQKENINKCLSKFTKEWMVILFHYDGHMDGWDEFEWSHRAIHISVKKQAKWWYAKRFLHPDVVEPYEYIFIWDEDLDVQHFDSTLYIELVKKHGLDISQPAIDQSKGMTWKMTGRRGDVEVHKLTEERPGWCPSPQLPPCAAFVEIMAPVFSRQAWRCVWYLIQSDLVHGWGLDFNLRRCVEPAHEKIGVVDAQWIIHMGVPTLGSQGQAVDGKQGWQGVRARCQLEWEMFTERMKKADEMLASSKLPSNE